MVRTEKCGICASETNFSNQRRPQMLCIRCVHFKIRRMVVKTNSILVVNYFIARQKPPELLFGDQSMFCD